MSAPTVGAAGTAQGQSDADVTPTLPAGIAAGDIIVVWVVSACAVTDTPTSAFGWPAGYTEGRAVPIKDATGGIVGLAGWAWKRTTGADSGTITITRDGTTGPSTSLLSNCVAITGCRATGNPYEVEVVNNPNYSTTIDWPSITTTGPNDTLLTMFLNGDNVSVATPAGWATVASNASATGKDSAADVDKRENVGPGTYDPANGTSSSDAGWATFQIAFTDQPETSVRPLQVFYSTSVVGAAIRKSGLKVTSKLNMPTTLGEPVIPPGPAADETFMTRHGIGMGHW